MSVNAWVVESVRAVSQCQDVVTINNLATMAVFVSPSSLDSPRDAASVRLDSLDVSVNWTSMTVPRSRASMVSTSDSHSRHVTAADSVSKTTLLLIFEILL